LRNVHNTAGFEQHARVRSVTMRTRTHDGEAKSGEPKANVRAAVGGKSGNDEHAPQHQPAAKRDQALLTVMRADPEVSLADLIRLGRPRTSTVSSLKRLEEAGLVRHPGKSVYAAVGRALIEAQKPKSAWASR
jgi:hypothetical protein